MIPARFPAVEKSDWPGLIGHRIMRLDFTAVVSPALAASIGGIHRPADLLRLPIISRGDPWWKQWFRHAGVANPDLGSRAASDYGVQAFDAEAAIAGQGVAIINPEHYASDIAAGRLLVPFDVRCNDGRDYWLVYAENRRNLPKIRAFRTWVLKAFPEIPDRAPTGHAGPDTQV